MITKAREHHSEHSDKKRTPKIVSEIQAIIYIVIRLVVHENFQYFSYMDQF